MLKGIATAEDAKIAVEHGVDVVWVSNHGGRQLDHDRGTMTMLPEIVEAVDGKAEIVLDGGVQRGADILKAVSLGATTVALGKMQGWGLAADGQGRRSSHAGDTGGRDNRRDVADGRDVD